MVERLFLAVPLGCLQFVIVVFPDHTHLLYSRYLTIEREVVNTLFTAQVQSDLNKLSAEAAVEHYSISVDKCDNSEIVCTRCLTKGSLTSLHRCTGCKSSSYCSKDCHRLYWPSHKQLCKSIQSQNPQN